MNSNSEYISNIISLLDDQYLCIPDYQRPYKWSTKSVEDLLIDIESSIKESKQYTEFKYRIGSILLHSHDGIKDIVDGQQRIITLLILGLCLGMELKCGLLSRKFENKTSQRNIHANAMFIKQWLTQKSPELLESIKKSFSDILEVVVISVEQYSEAFQLFDSQNSRGKRLDPHDLLKAYHLREMRSDLFEMEHAVQIWESKDPDDIRRIFGTYLFPIINWSRREKSQKFTDKKIDLFKGVCEQWQYTYAKQAVKSVPCFQISSPIVAGESFFLYVDHYLQMHKDIERYLKEDPQFKAIWEWIDAEKAKKYGVGFGYCVELFKRALMCYYDRFHSFDYPAVSKLFSWAFLIRVEMTHLGFDTINNYAIGYGGHVNNIAMFSLINSARRHTEISSIKLECKVKNPANDWNKLYTFIKILNGYGK